MVGVRVSVGTSVKVGVNVTVGVKVKLGTDVSVHESAVVVACASGDSRLHESRKTTKINNRLYFFN